MKNQYTVEMLIIFSNKYIYIQLIDINLKKTLTSLSSKSFMGGNNKKSSLILSNKIYEYLKILNIKKINLKIKKKKYHGKIKYIMEKLKQQDIKT